MSGVCASQQGPHLAAKPASLLLVSFPHQLLHALSALRHERRQSGVAEDAPAILLFWSYQAANHAADSEVCKFLTDALLAFPWVRLNIPSRRARTMHLSPYRRLIDRVKWFQHYLGDTHYEAYFFSHDASADHTAQALMQAFPTARRICYGDPPGFLYPPLKKPGDSHFSRGKIKRLFWNSRMVGVKKLMSAHKSIVAVNFQHQVNVKDVEVMPRELMLDTLRSIKSGVNGFSLIDQAWISTAINSGLTMHLLLMSNFSDGGLANFDNEIELYVALCSIHVPAGSQILIKPHAGTKRKFIECLVNKLDDWKVGVLPEALQNVPIEFIPELITNCRVLSVSSASVLLAHLFDCEVTHGLTDKLIDEYFNKECARDFGRSNKEMERKLSAIRQLRFSKNSYAEGHLSTKAAANLNVLFVARDTGAAGHIAALIEAAESNGVGSYLVAEGAAADYFSEKNLRFWSASKWFNVGANQPTQSEAIDLCVDKLKALKIDVVVCGRSSEENHGLEKFILWAAKSSNVQSIVMQDFWGDITNYDCCPDHYFVIDNLAAKITRQRVGASIHVVGSPKHARYKELDFEQLRENGRRLVSASLTTKLITFFGQDLLFLEGYKKVLQDVGAVVCEIEEAMFVYKPHPREKQASIEATLGILRDVGANPILLKDAAPELVTASSDLVLSCFSTIALDAAYMMSSSKATAVSIVCCDYPEDVSSYWRPATGLSEFPLVSEGLALAAQDIETLRDSIQKGLNDSERERQQRQSQSIFGVQGTSVDQAFAAIRAICAGSSKKAAR